MKTNERSKGHIPAIHLFLVALGQRPYYMINDNNCEKDRKRQISTMYGVITQAELPHYLVYLSTLSYTRTKWLDGYLVMGDVYGRWCLWSCDGKLVQKH